MNIFVTGVAGFIGFHVAKKLLERGDRVIGIDNLNDYYSPSLKIDRKDLLGEMYENFEFYHADICEMASLRSIFARHKIDRICHLAAQAGVRHSLIDPFIYEKVNGMGTLNVFEIAKEFPVENLIYASSSSVYGANTKAPLSEIDPVDHPMSLYASTKRANELTARVYSDIFSIPMTGLRFFTVYGPWGRPDMALFLFIDRMLNGLPIDLYNNGDMSRNFTYIDDITRGVISAIDTPFPYEIFNLCGPENITLMQFIAIIERELGIKAYKQFVPMPNCDVKGTEASIDHAQKLLGYAPKVSVESGISRSVTWYRGYYER